MTNSQVFLYNKYCIHYHSFYDDFNAEKNQMKVDFQIVKCWHSKESTKYSEKFGQFIQEVRAGSEPNKIVIIVNDSINNADNLIIWDVETNSELEFFDAPDDDY